MLPTPQEVLKDLHGQGALRDGYVYPAALEPLEESFRAFLVNLRDELNNDLRDVSRNVLFDFTPPGFYLDYVDATELNATALSSGNYSFVLFTVPMVKRLLETSDRLSELSFVSELLALPPVSSRPLLRTMLFSLQFTFLVCHEFSHHAFGHVGTIRKEFHDSPNNQGLAWQVHEVEADTYAAYIALAHLFDGAGGKPADTFFAEQHRSTALDEVLLGLFILAVGTLFYTLPGLSVDSTTVTQRHHPPEDLRMNYIMHSTASWCNQSRPALELWLTPTRFQSYIRPLIQATRGPVAAGSSLSPQSVFLSSPDGAKYRDELEQLRLARFAARRERKRSKQAADAEST